MVFTKWRQIYRVTAKVDDNMVEHYCNEDTYVIHIQMDNNTGNQRPSYTITLVELAAVDGGGGGNQQRQSISCITTTSQH
jgi:hypothetical protein